MQESERAKQSMLFHEEIKSNKYALDFVTSPWAIGEVAHAVLNYSISLRMIKEGRSLDKFHRWKPQYLPTQEERKELQASLDSFLKHLNRLKITVKPFEVEARRIQDISLRYDIDASDALHIAMALDGCHYFVTNDRELCEKGVDEISVLLPANLTTKPALRVK